MISLSRGLLTTQFQSETLSGSCWFFVLADALEILQPCKWKIIRNKVTKTEQNKLVCSVSIPSTLWEPQFSKPWWRQETLLSVWGYRFFPHWKEVLKPGRIQTPTQDPACKTNRERLIPCELIHSVTECPPPPRQKRVPTGQWNIWTCPPHSVCTAFMLCSRDSDSFSASTSIPFYFAPRIDKLYHFYTESVKNNSYQEPGFVWLRGGNKYQNKSFKKRSSRSRLKSISISKITLHFLYHCLTVITISWDHTLTSSGKCSLLDPLFRH